MDTTLESDVCLVNFKYNGKTCKWPGCSNKAVTPLNCSEAVVGKTIHCLKHHLRKRSGRVGPNWYRDRHREHLKSTCMLTGVRWSDQYKITKMMAEKLGANLSRYELIRRTCQAFDVDHIDGNHHNNNPDNLQTLYKPAHKFKTDVCGDANPQKKKGMKNDYKKVHLGKVSERRNSQVSSSSNGSKPTRRKLPGSSTSAYVPLPC